MCPGSWCRILKVYSQHERGTQSWNVLWQNLFCSFCYQSRRNIVLQSLMTWLKPLPMNQISSRSQLWRGLRCQCPIYNVSCISYLLQYMSLFFIVHGWILSGQTSYIYCAHIYREQECRTHDRFSIMKGAPSHMLHIYQYTLLCMQYT